MKESYKAFLYIFILILTGSPSISYSNNSKSGNLKTAMEIAEERPDEALKMIREVISGLDPYDNPELASKAFFLLGECYYYLDELDSTLIYYQKAIDIDILHGTEKTPDHINILGNMGYMYDTMDKKLLALDYYERALELAREIDQKDEIAANLANIAQLKTIQGFYEEALRNMEEALVLDKQIGDESVIAVDLNIIGRIYESWGLYDQAVRYLQESLEIVRRLGQEDKLTIRLNSLGLVYKSWQKYDTALKYFNQAMLIDQKHGKQEKVALRRANIGSTYLEMGEIVKAISSLEQSLDYFRENNLPSYVATTLNDLGRCYLAQNNYSKAEKYFTESAGICRHYNFVRFLLNSLDQLSEIYNITGRDNEAFTTLKEFTILKDSIFDLESQNKVAEFNARYELDKKQQENELLRRDNELAKKKHMVANLLYSIGGLVLIVILLIVLIRLNSFRNRKLITEKENEKLKIDLEQKNKELTYNAMCIIKNNETVAKIAETLEEAILVGDNQADLGKMVRKLQNVEREKNWSEFELRFTRVHEDFYNKLHTRFPDLTPNEKKLCAFLKLNMSTKDIAAITHQSVHSINVARTRMRKKLGIDQTDENLVNFLGAL